MWYKICSFRD